MGAALFGDDVGGDVGGPRGDFVMTSAEAAKKASERGRSEALTTCQQAVRRDAKFPSKADFYVLDTAIVELPGMGWQVTGKVDLMNGFGAMIPHNYLCETPPHGQTVLINLMLPEG
jgi:hypothetical protein